MPGCGWAGPLPATTTVTTVVVAFLAVAAAPGAASDASCALVGLVAPAGTVGPVTGIVGAAGGLGGLVPHPLLGVVHGTVGNDEPGPALRAVAAVLAAVHSAVALQVIGSGSAG